MGVTTTTLTRGSMSNLAVFDFNSNQVRVIEVNGEPWFVAKDICDVLDLSDVSKACERLKDREKLTRTLFVSGQNREVICISEAGLYRLILTSRKPQAEAFQDWVCQEVIPSIRKTGSYSVEQKPTDAVAIAHSVIDSIFSKVPIKPELVAGLKLNIAQKRLPELAEDLEESRQLLINSTAQPHELLTPTQIGERLGLSAIAVNKLLLERGFQVKNSQKKGRKDSSYLPTGKGLEFSDLTLATGKGTNGTSYQQLRWYSSILDQL